MVEEMPILPSLPSRHFRSFFICFDVGCIFVCSSNTVKKEIPKGEWCETDRIRFCCVISKSNRSRERSRWLEAREKWKINSRSVSVYGVIKSCGTERTPTAKGAAGKWMETAIGLKIECMATSITTRRLLRCDVVACSDCPAAGLCVCVPGSRSSVFVFARSPNKPVSREGWKGKLWWKHLIDKLIEPPSAPHRATTRQCAVISFVVATTKPKAALQRAYY